MTVVEQAIDGRPVELDLCRGCQLVWFDDGEDDQVAGTLPEPPPDPLAHLDPADQLEVRTATARLAMEAREHRAGYDDEPRHYTGLDKMGALLGFPVEDGAPTRSVTPWITWAVCAAAALGSVSALTHLDTVYSSVGFLAEAPLRGGGVPAVVGVFADPRPLSVVFNLGVLLRFGDNVEDLLGGVGYAALLGAATVAGWGVHALGLSHEGQPMMGLTAGASAVAVLYALRFPWVTLGWYQYHRQTFFRRVEGGWWQVPVRWAVIGWVLLVAALPWMEAEPEVPNSWAEAFVGAAVGVGAWALFGKGVLQHPDARA